MKRLSWQCFIVLVSILFGSHTTAFAQSAPLEPPQYTGSILKYEDDAVHVWHLSGTSPTYAPLKIADASLFPGVCQAAQSQFYAGRSCTYWPAVGPRLISASNGYWALECPLDFYCDNRQGSSIASYAIVSVCPPLYTQNLVGGSWNSTSPQACVRVSLPNKNLGGEQCCVGQKIPLLYGHPINAGTGNKYLEEVDYLGSGPFPLKLARRYNSQAFARNASNFQPGLWQLTYSRSVTVLNDQLTAALVTLADGAQRYFVKVNGVWQSDADVTDQLTQLTDQNGITTGWTYRNRKEELETFNIMGRLVSVKNRQGFAHTLSYNSTGQLISISDDFGRAITVSRPTATQEQYLDPDGKIYLYTFDTSRRLLSVTYPDQTQRQFRYENSNQYGALTGIVDEQGIRYATYSFDYLGRGISSELALGADKVTMTYNANGTTTITDARNVARTLSVQSILGVVRPQGLIQPCISGCTMSRSNSFDVNGNVTTATDFGGRQTTYGHDLTRNLETSRTEAYGTSKARTITTSWHSTYRLPTLISMYAGGTATGTPFQTTAFTYDSSGNQLTKTTNDPVNSISRTWTYTYDSYGRVLTADGPRTDVSDVTTYTYYTCTTGYQCGQVQTIMDALGRVTTYNTYNAHGQPLTITDPNGVVTTLTYDLRQRLTSRAIGSEAMSFEYWPTGLLKKVTLPDGSYLSYTYDAAHRPTQITDGEGNKVVYTLDAMGNRTAENLYDPSNALTRTHSRVFNTLSQLWKDIPAAGTSAQTTLFGYDNNGNQTTINAPLTRNTSNQYDALNRLSQVTDPNSGITQYGYDANDNLTSVTDPRSLTTSYTYNGLGDLTQQVSPDTGTTTSTYDAAGNLATRTDARSAVTSYGYDAVNRVTSASYTLSGITDQALTFSYDTGTNGLGRLTGVSDATHALAWSYNAQGRVTGKGQTIDGLTKGIGYNYTNGNLTQLITPSGQVINYGYSNGHVTSITVNGTTLLSNVLYDPFGPTRGWTWGNGTYAVRTYDTDGKVTQIDSAGLRTLGYDDAFRITSLTDTVNSANNWSYGWDALDRLTSATNSSLLRSWTFDASGNRTGEGGTTGSIFTVVSSSNHLSSVSGALARSYSYDAAGNTTSDGARTFVYNNAGRMSSVTNGGVTTYYFYNALGERVKKSNASGTTYFIHDEAGHLLSEYDGSGNLTQETVWMGDIPVATLRPHTGGGIDIYYLHTDHLNAPIKVTRPSDNAIVWRLDKDPYETVAANENPSGLGIFNFNLRSSWGYWDQESGLIQTWMRDRDPTTGRFPTSDPIGMRGGVNTYSYVLNDPLSYIDPYGLDVQMCRQPAFGWMPIDHQWLKTDKMEAGMGGTRGNEPGNQSGDMIGDPVQVTDHSGRSEQQGASCESVPNVDEKKVNEQLVIGKPLGRWGPFNQCQSFVKDVLKNARYSPGASGSWGIGATGTW